MVLTFYLIKNKTTKTNSYSIYLHDRGLISSKRLLNSFSIYVYESAAVTYIV